MAEQKQPHPGEIPHVINNLRQAIIILCQNSGAHPTFCSLVLREVARAFDDQAEMYLKQFLAEAQAEMGKKNSPKATQYSSATDAQSAAASDCQ